MSSELRRTSPTLRSTSMPTASAVSAIGRTIRNIQRQESDSRMIPETVGPSAGATEMTMLTVPIIVPRACAGTTRSTVVMSSGMAIAVPLAWTMRPSSRSGKPGETAAMRVPRLNSDKAAIKEARRLNRCRMNPVIGMTTAIVSRKAVDSHCTVHALTPSSTIRLGRATFMMVSFRMTTKAAISSTMIMRRSPGAMRYLELETVAACVVIVRLDCRLRYPGRSSAAESTASTSPGWYSCTNKPGLPVRGRARAGRCKLVIAWPGECAVTGWSQGATIRTERGPVALAGRPGGRARHRPAARGIHPGGPAVAGSHHLPGHLHRPVLRVPGALGAVEAAPVRRRRDDPCVPHRRTHLRQQLAIGRGRVAGRPAGLPHRPGPGGRAARAHTLHPGLRRERPPERPGEPGRSRHERCPGGTSGCDRGNLVAPRDCRQAAASEAAGAGSATQANGPDPAGLEAARTQPLGGHPGDQCSGDSRSYKPAPGHTARLLGDSCRRCDPAGEPPGADHRRPGDPTHHRNPAGHRHLRADKPAAPGWLVVGPAGLGPRIRGRTGHRQALRSGVAVHYSAGAHHQYREPERQSAWRA